MQHDTHASPSFISCYSLATFASSFERARAASVGEVSTNIRTKHGLHFMLSMENIFAMSARVPRFPVARSCFQMLDGQIWVRKSCCFVSKVFWRSSKGALLWIIEFFWRNSSISTLHSTLLPHTQQHGKSGMMMQWTIEQQLLTLILANVTMPKRKIWQCSWPPVRLSWT